MIGSASGESGHAGWAPWRQLPTANCQPDLLVNSFKFREANCRCSWWAAVWLYSGPIWAAFVQRTCL